MRAPIFLQRRMKDGLARVRRNALVDIVWRTKTGYVEMQGSVYAAAITYYVLLSLFPALLVLVSVFGLVLRDSGLRENVVDQIVRQIPEGVYLRDEVRTLITDTTQTSGGLFGLVGVLLTAWTASSVFAAVRRALNQAFDVPLARAFIHGRLIDLVSLIGIALLVTASSALTAALSILRAASEQRVGGDLATTGWAVAYVALPLAISFLVFWLVYRLIPNHTLGWRDLWIGALVAALGFELAKTGFAVYLANFNRYDDVYGALGGVVAFLVFVFLVANLVIFAARLACEVANARAGTDAD
jgi:membrane protein